MLTVLFYLNYIFLGYAFVNRLATNHFTNKCFYQSFHSFRQRVHM